MTCAFWHFGLCTVSCGTYCHKRNISGYCDILVSILAKPKVHCMSSASCFYSAATSAVCIEGCWAGWTEMKQEVLRMKPDF